MDDRTLREVYVHPFLRAVQADVASVMCSYNLLNGSWGGQNAKTLNGILKTDLGFPGYVMSDWDATHSGVLASLSGLDMDMVSWICDLDCANVSLVTSTSMAARLPTSAAT